MVSRKISLVVYVNDIVFFRDDMHEIQLLKSLLRSKILDHGFKRAAIFLRIEVADLIMTFLCLKRNIL